jgi:arylformamidase
VGAGAAYVALDFALLPSVTLPEMVSQVCRAIEWVYRNLAADIVLCGHSSGSHLAACALTRTDGVKSALLVSGEYVRVDEKLEHEYSPIRHMDRIGCPVTVAWAEHEAAEFYRQSLEFSSALKRTGKLAEAMVGKGLNHFEIIETLADPASPLGRAALNMLA